MNLEAVALMALLLLCAVHATGVNSGNAGASGQPSRVSSAHVFRKNPPQKALLPKLDTESLASQEVAVLY